MYNYLSGRKYSFRLFLSLLILFFFSGISFSQSVDFKQAANKNNGFPLGSVRWINSILQQSKSVYYEGMAVPQRIILNNLTPGTHTLVINHQAIKQSSGRHAYDFLTSWDKAKKAAEVMNPSNPLLFDLFTNQCGDEIPNSFISVCNSRAYSLGVPIPAPSSNPTPTYGTGNVATKKAAFDAAFPAEQPNLMIWGSAPISGGSLVFNSYQGNDQDAYYTLTWTSNSTTAVIEFAGHLASGDDFFDPNIGWGTNKGSGDISGAPFHIKLGQLDGGSIGSQDNQINDVLGRSCGTISVTQTDVLCKGASTGSITVNVSGGVAPFNYSLNGGTSQSSNIFENLGAGNYTVLVTDASGCQRTSQVTINEPLTAVSITVTPGTILCNGGTTTVEVSGSGGTGTITGGGSFTVGAGTYTYTVSDENGCSASSTITITEPTQLSASAEAGTILCNGGSTTIVVSASGGTGPYQGTGSFTVQAGAYSYTVTDNNGCAATVSGTITEPTLLQAAAEAGTILCNGGSTTIVVSASGGTAPYQGTGSFTVQAGSYSYTVTDNNGCTSTVSGNISQPSLLEATVSNVTHLVCKGENTGSITVSASGGTLNYSYSKDGTNFQSSPTFNNLAAGNYTITVKDGNGCITTVSTTVNDGPVCYPHYTYTQGYYGNSGGKSCIRSEGLQSTYQIILRSLQNGGPMVLGRSIVNRTFTAYANNNDVNKLISVLPAGGSAAVINGNLNLTTNMPPLQNGKIRNVLLGQTITLWLNLNIPGNGALGSLDLMGANNKNYIVTIAVAANAPCTEPFRASCSNNPGAYSSTLFPQSVLNALIARGGGTTVNSLLSFASEALGGGALFGTTLSNINAAVDAINNAFDKGRYFDSFSATVVGCSSSTGRMQNPEIVTATSGNSNTETQLVTEEKIQLTEARITTYPNPFKGSVTFRFAIPENGNVRLEVYNSDGKLVNVAFQGRVLGSVENTVLYTPKGNAGSMLIYRLITPNKVLTGKLMAIE
ncbi:MAG TPA: hypothetical protein VFV31_15580 [Chitinophagaceae bacterium]|nr:hypothetical protein [Chitinophagaceae bacterium]